MKADPTFDVTTYWRVLQRRKWLLLLPLVLLTGIVGAGSFLLPSIYLATAYMVVRQEQEPVRGLAVETQITRQLGGVIEALSAPARQREVYQRLEQERPANLSETEALQDFKDHLGIRQRASGSVLIIDFAYEGTPEKYAIAVANAFADEFQADATKLVEQGLTVSIDFVDSSLEDYRRRIRKLNSDERAIQTQLASRFGGLASVSAERGLTRAVAEQIYEGESKIKENNLQLDALAAQVKYLENQLAQTPRMLQVKGGDRMSQTQANLEQLLAQARGRLVVLTLRYTDDHPDVAALNEQIRDLERRLKEVSTEGKEERAEVPNPAYEKVQDELVKWQAQIRFTTAQRDTVEQRNHDLGLLSKDLPAIEEDVTRIREERAALQSIYNGLLSRQKQLEMNQSFEEGQDTGRFELRKAGELPLRPIRPNRKKLVAMGFMGGLFLGFSFLLLAEYLDHAVRRESDLHHFVEAPILAVLPRAPN